MSKNNTLRFGPPGENAVHLCVDMQRMFAEATEWKMPWLERVLPLVVRGSVRDGQPRASHPLLRFKGS